MLSVTSVNWAKKLRSRGRRRVRRLAMAPFPRRFGFRRSRLLFVLESRKQARPLERPTIPAGVAAGNLLLGSGSRGGRQAINDFEELLGAEAHFVVFGQVHPADGAAGVDE